MKRLRHLDFDVSEIYFNYDFYNILFRDFFELSDSLESLNLNFFNSNIGNQDCREIL